MTTAEKKEAAAKAAAEKKEAAAKAAAEIFIAMRKGDETIHVCPEQVGQHQRLGWTVVEGGE